MVTNVSVHYNGGFLPDMILLLLTLCYYHRGTRLNCKCHEEVVFTAYETVPHPNVLTLFPPVWGMLRRFRCVQTFLLKLQ